MQSNGLEVCFIDMNFVTSGLENFNNAFVSVHVSYNFELGDHTCVKNPTYLSMYRISKWYKLKNQT